MKYFYSLVFNIKTHFGGIFILDDRDRRHPSPHDNGDRYRERERYGDPVPRLSAEDIKRYEFLQRRREERERELSDLSLQVDINSYFLQHF